MPMGLMRIIIIWVVRDFVHPHRPFTYYVTRIIQCFLINNHKNKHLLLSFLLASWILCQTIINSEQILSIFRCFFYSKQLFIQRTQLTHEDSPSYHSHLINEYQHCRSFNLHRFLSFVYRFWIDFYNFPTNWLIILHNRNKKVRI